MDWLNKFNQKYIQQKYIQPQKIKELFYKWKSAPSLQVDSLSSEPQGKPCFKI